MKQLFEQGYSHEKLAERLRRNKSLIRELIILGGLLKDLEEAYLEGKVDRKKVLKMARARKNDIKSTAPLTPENPQRVLDQNPPPEPTAVVRTGKRQQSSVSAMTEEERQEKISEYAKLIVDWVPQTGLRLCDYGAFFKGVDSALDGTRSWLFRNEAPKPHEIRPDEDPWKVIQHCKVVGGNPQSAPDVTNNAVTWLARWIQRVIPDQEMIKEAISRARTQLFELSL